MAGFSLSAVNVNPITTTYSTKFSQSFTLDRAPKNWQKIEDTIKKIPGLNKMTRTSP
jgi:hypothetical protein